MQERDGDVEDVLVNLYSDTKEFPSPYAGQISVNFGFEHRERGRQCINQLIHWYERKSMCDVRRRSPGMYGWHKGRREWEAFT